MQYVCLDFVMSRLLYVMENNLFQKGKISAQLLLLFQIVSQFLYPFGRMHAHIQGNHRNQGAFICFRTTVRCIAYAMVDF